MREKNSNRSIIIGGICAFFALIFAAFIFNDKVTYSVTYTCPNGGTLSGTKCEKEYSKLYAVDEYTAAVNNITVDGWNCVFSSITNNYLPSDQTTLIGYKVTYNCTMDAVQEEIKVSKPSCRTLTYNGSTQTLMNSGTGYSLLSATRMSVGSQTVTATLKDGYVWDDGDTSRTYSTKCSIGVASSSVSVSPLSSSGQTGYLTSTNASVSSKCDGTITVSTNGLSYLGTSPMNFSVGSKVTELNFKVTKICGQATATVSFTPDSNNCTTASATYKYSLPACSSSSSSSSSSGALICSAGKYANGMECSECPANYYCPGNLSGGVAIKNECPENSISQSGSQSIEDCICDSGYTWNSTSKTCVKKSNPSSSSSSSSSSGLPSSSSSSGNSSSSAGGDKIDPIYSIMLDNSNLCIGEKTALHFEANVVGKIVLSSSNSDILTLTNSEVIIGAGRKTEVSLVGTGSGETTLSVQFIPNDSSKYNAVIKMYDLVVAKTCDGNINTNPTTGNIMLFIVWSIGLAMVGYSFWYFKTSRDNY